MIFIINAVVFMFLMLIWNHKDWINLSIKAGLVGLFCANAFYALQAYGWIVRVA